MVQPRNLAGALVSAKRTERYRPTALIGVELALSKYLSDLSWCGRFQKSLRGSLVAAETIQDLQFTLLSLHQVILNDRAVQEMEKLPHRSKWQLAEEFEIDDGGNTIVDHGVGQVAGVHLCPHEGVYIRTATFVDGGSVHGPGTLELSWLIHERVRTFGIQNGQREMDYDTALPADDSIVAARSTQAAASSPEKGDEKMVTSQTTESPVVDGGRNWTVAATRALVQSWRKVSIEGGGRQQGVTRLPAHLHRVPAVSAHHEAHSQGAGRQDGYPQRNLQVHLGLQRPPRGRQYGSWPLE
ncbi:unnamed protein product [Phytophthora fragariaefolia]|uniref:Unnamed protein product n=1 Tax=Phytophthora fragariaefolia TaxID=1490495 RepID=A0A9W6UCG3_9STRA|nr:unnamed protein product [Phytophthora fragariaefolia]